MVFWPSNQDILWFSGKRMSEDRFALTYREILIVNCYGFYVMYIFC